MQRMPSSLNYLIMILKSPNEGFAVRVHMVEPFGCTSWLQSIEYDVFNNDQNKSKDTFLSFFHLFCLSIFVQCRLKFFEMGIYNNYYYIGEYALEFIFGFILLTVDDGDANRYFDKRMTKTSSLDTHLDFVMKYYWFRLKF